jgi:hypothetical protein
LARVVLAESSPVMSQENNDFVIAALGSRHMPSDGGVAFIVVQHLVPDPATVLPKLPAKYTDMAVEQARDCTQVIPNRVYIIPPNATLTIRESGSNKHRATLLGSVRYIEKPSQLEEFLGTVGRGVKEMLHDFSKDSEFI